MINNFVRAITFIALAGALMMLVGLCTAVACDSVIVHLCALVIGLSVYFLAYGILLLSAEEA